MLFVLLSITRNYVVSVQRGFPLGAYDRQHYFIVALL